MPGVLAQFVGERNRHSDHEEQFLCALRAASDMDAIVASSGLFLGLPRAQKLEALYEDFCLRMNVLTMDSIAQGKLLYNQTVKLHMMQHTCQLAKFCNPRLLWAYRWEVLMQKMIRCASNCTRSTSSEQVGNKTMVCYKHVFLLMIRKSRDLL